METATVVGIRMYNTLLHPGCAGAMILTRVVMSLPRAREACIMMPMVLSAGTSGIVGRNGVHGNFAGSPGHLIISKVSSGFMGLIVCLPAFQFHISAFFRVLLACASFPSGVARTRFRILKGTLRTFGR